MRDRAQTCTPPTAGVGMSGPGWALALTTQSGHRSLMGPWPSSQWPGQPAGASQGPGARLTLATVDPLEICVKLVGCCWSRPCALYLAGARPLRQAATVSTLQPLGQEPARQQGRQSHSHTTLADSCVTVVTGGVSDQGRPRHKRPRQHLCRATRHPVQGPRSPNWGFSAAVSSGHIRGSRDYCHSGSMSLLSATLTAPALATVSQCQPHTRRSNHTDNT